MRFHVLDAAFYLKCGERTIASSVRIVLSCLSMPMRSCAPQPNRMSSWLNFRRNAYMWCWERQIQSDMVETKSYAATCSTSETRYCSTSVCVNVFVRACCLCAVSALCVGAGTQKTKMHRGYQDLGRRCHPWRLADPPRPSNLQHCDDASLHVPVQRIFLNI